LPRRRRAVACTPPGSRGVRVSFRGSWCRTSSALLASRAPPTPFDGLGVFLVRPDSRDRLRSREVLSWSSCPLQSRTTSRLPVPGLVRGPLARIVTAVQARKIASPGVLSPSSTVYAGCPFHRRTGRVAPTRGAEGGGRQAPTGAVLRVLAPLDGSGCARGACGLLPESVVCRDAPTLRGLVSCRSRPWSRPSELSLLEEPYPLSRASCFRAGSRSTTHRRDRPEWFAAPFPGAPTSRPSSPRGPLRDRGERLDCKAGTTVPRSR